MLMWLCGILHKQYGGVWWVWTSNCFLHINFLWLTLIGLCQNLLDSVIKNYSCKPMLHGNIGGHTWSMHQLICHTSFLLIVYFLSGYRVLQRWGVTNKISSRNLQQWIKYFIENFVETLYLLGGWNPWKIMLSTQLHDLYFVLIAFTVCNLRLYLKVSARLKWRQCKQF